MALDWKDALAGLRDSGTIPEAADNSAPEAAEQEACSSKKGKVNIIYTRKGRGGKDATIIEGFNCSDEELKETASKMKRQLGIGGSCRDGEILLQGDVRKKAAELLRAMGYTTNKV